MDWKEIASSILDTVKARSKDFLDNNQDAEAFIKERAERLAKLTVEYGIAGAGDRQAIKDQMSLVTDTIETELLAVALHGEAESKNTFREIVGSVFGILIKVLPAVL